MRFVLFGTGPLCAWRGASPLERARVYRDKLYSTERESLVSSAIARDHARVSAFSASRASAPLASRIMLAPFAGECAWRGASPLERARVYRGKLHSTERESLVSCAIGRDLARVSAFSASRVSAPLASCIVLAAPFAGSAGINFLCFRHNQCRNQTLHLTRQVRN